MWLERLTGLVLAVHHVASLRTGSGLPATVRRAHAFPWPSAYFTTREHASAKASEMRPPGPPPFTISSRSGSRFVREARLGEPVGEHDVVGHGAEVAGNYRAKRIGGDALALRHGDAELRAGAAPTRAAAYHGSRGTPLRYRDKPCTFQ